LSSTNSIKKSYHTSFPLKTLNTIFTKREKKSPFPKHVHTRAQKSTSKSSTNLEATKRKREARDGERERKKSEREEKKVPQNVDIYTHI